MTPEIISLTKGTILNPSHVSQCLTINEITLLNLNVTVVRADVWWSCGKQTFWESLPPYGWEGVLFFLLSPPYR